jgi:syntaxin-binding protein 1
MFSMQDTSAAFSSEMRGVFRENFGGQKSARKGPPRNNALLVLVDRSVDPVGPLLHDLYYESLIHDTVPLTEYGDLELAYQNAKGEEKVTHTPLADPDDPIWTHCKHMHLADFLTYINKAFSDFKDDFPEFFPGDGASPDLKARMQRMTEYAEKNAQFSKHLHLDKCLQRSPYA